MERNIAKTFAALLLIIIILSTSSDVHGQQTGGSSSSSFCSSSMLQSFSPCINYLSNGGSGGSPTSQCCNSLKDLMSSGRDCLCLIITGGIALSLPINRTLAAALPKACRSSGAVPIECKALPGSPIPSPGPGILNQPPPSWLPSGPPAGDDGTLTPPGDDGNGQGSGGGGGGGTLPGLTPGSGGFPAMTPPGIRPDLSNAQPSPRFLIPSLITFAWFHCFQLLVMNH